MQRRHWGGAEGRRPLPRKKRKKEKKKKREKKQKEKEKKIAVRKKEGNYMNNVKLLHIKCCFFQFFNSPVTLKNFNNFAPPPKKKVEMTPLYVCLFWI